MLFPTPVWKLLNKCIQNFEVFSHGKVAEAKLCRLGNICKLHTIIELINSRTAYVGHVTKVSDKINHLIENCEHYKKLDCLQDQIMSLSETIKDIHNQILELVHFPDQYFVTCNLSGVLLQWKF